MIPASLRVKRRFDRLGEDEAIRCLPEVRLREARLPEVRLPDGRR
jgi:hypothetical protein